MVPAGIVGRWLVCGHALAGGLVARLEADLHRRRVLRGYTPSAKRGALFERNDVIKFVFTTIQSMKVPYMDKGWSLSHKVLLCTLCTLIQVEKECLGTAVPSQ